VEDDFIIGVIGSAPLNDHLVWLWGILQHERRYLKSLPAERVEIRVSVAVAAEPGPALCACAR
jgi:hypothetical protein